MLAVCASVFQDRHEGSIYAKRFRRGARQPGLNFLAYGDLLSPKAPWTVIYNMKGSCSVRFFALPDWLVQRYFRDHIDPSDDHFQWRQRLSEAALEDSIESPAVGIMDPGTGFVLPQIRGGFHWVHEFLPHDATDPGEFIEFAVPDHRASILEANGYESLGKCLRRGLPVASERMTDPTRTS